MNLPPDPSDIRPNNNPVNIEQPENFRSRIRQLPLIPILAIVLVGIGLAFLVLSLRGSSDHPLYPILPSFTPSSGTVNYEPIVLNFAELNKDPATYLGQRIQVSGIFTPVAPPGCLDHNGPNVKWSLVSEELQLNAIGFENLLQLLSEGTEMTVTGIWNAYQGPVGCGKGPSTGTVWFLAVDRIVEPNPLFSSSGVVITVIPGEQTQFTPSIEVTEAITLTATVPLTSTEPITATATLGSISPPLMTPTPDITSLPVTPLSTPGATPSITSEVTTGTPTTAPGVTPGATINPLETPTLGLPTSTPSSGYPGPSSPTPTTPGGYP